MDMVKEYRGFIFCGGLPSDGIATILRLDTFGIRRTLVKLIIAALLVNFSIMIAGVLIDLLRFSLIIFWTR